KSRHFSPRRLLHDTDVWRAAGQGSRGAGRYPPAPRTVGDLEGEPQRQLNLARIAYSAGDGSGSRVTNAGIWQAELRRVEQIERFRAELEILALAKGKVLEEREIEVYPSGS